MDKLSSIFFCFLAHGLGINVEEGAGVHHELQGGALTLPVSAVTEKSMFM